MSAAISSNAGKKSILFASLLIVVASSILLYLQPQSRRASKLLGGPRYASVISSPETIEVFKTTTLLAKTTNGPLPERFETIEPGKMLPSPAVERIRIILTDPTSYTERLGDTAPLAPEIVLRLKRGQKSIDLQFSDDLREVSVKRDGTCRTLSCEPARHELERAIGPFLDQHPHYWHVD
jgi:hypothetical protein